MSLATKNFIAKVFTLVWFGLLIFASFLLIKYAIRFDVNELLALPAAEALPKAILLEGKMIFFIIAMSIFWGVSFAIRVFYTSVRYANIYDQAYSDYRGKNITFDQFQKLIRVEMYVERFNYTWFLSFVTQPFGSVFLGIICYFIARSGLGFVSGVGELTVQSVYMYGVLSFLTGFYSNKFVEWLDHLSDKIFSKDFLDQKAEYKQQILEVTSNDAQGLKTSIAPATVVSPVPVIARQDAMPEYTDLTEDAEDAVVLNDAFPAPVAPQATPEVAPMKSVR